MTEKKGHGYLVPKILNGGLAGIVGVTCVFPIDLIKTRLQNQQVKANGTTQYRGIFDCAQKTWKAGGSNPFQRIKSFYSGSGVNILLITPEKAIKLVANDLFRHLLANQSELQSHKLPVFKGMVAGGGAGFCQIVVTTPMELLKIQMQMRTVPDISATQITRHLLKEKGVFGLYKGIWPTMARDVTFSVIYFPLFAALDSMGPRKADGSGDAVFYASFFAGLSAGAFASFSVTPLDVIKTRIQLMGKTDFEQYSGIYDSFLKILKTEGPHAFFKGALCRMLVMAPLFGIAQTVYYFGIAEYFLGTKKEVHI